MKASYVIELHKLFSELTSLTSGIVADALNISQRQATRLLAEYGRIYPVRYCPKAKGYILDNLIERIAGNRPVPRQGVTYRFHERPEGWTASCRQGDYHATTKAFTFSEIEAVDALNDVLRYEGRPDLVFAMYGLKTGKGVE
jgi:hypothetical protein